MHSLSKSKRLVVLVVVTLVLLCFLVPHVLRLQGSQSKVLQAPRSKIAKVSVAFSSLVSPTIERAFETHFRHNAMHGYRHFIAREVLVDEVDDHRRPKGTWSKPAYVLSILINELSKPPEKRLEWLFWFDADTIIANPYIPLEIFLPPNTEELPIHFVVASNFDGLNAGVFAVRVHRWSVALLSAVVAYPVYHTDKAETNDFQDQSALSWLLESSSSPTILSAKMHWANVPTRWFNSLPFNNAWASNGDWIYGTQMTPEKFDAGTTDVYDDGHDTKVVNPWKVMRGDLAIHFAGSTRVRDSWMVPWMERVESMTPEWADVGAKDRLQIEVAAFWESKANELRARQG